MNQRYRLYGIATAAGFAAVIFFAAFFAVGCSSNSKDNYSATGVDNLDISASFFDVEITGHSADSVDVEITIPPRLVRRGITVPHEKTGKDLRIHVEGRRRGSGFFNFQSPQIQVKVPFDTIVKVGASSGRISVEKINSRTISLSSSSGRINVSECNGPLQASASSGRISIDSCDGPKNVSSSSGRISVNNSDGDINANSSSGRQTYEQVEGSIVGSSSSGKISVSHAEGTLELQASSGNLRGEGVTLTGESSFRTSSGSINFDFSNDLSDFTFNLESSSGKINAGRTSARGIVVTGSGDILVAGKSTSGRQTYK